MRVYLSKEFDVRCPHCGRVVSYSNRYDSYFCMPCNRWIEEQCADPACEFCAGRAEEPDGLKDLDAAKPAEAEHTPPAMPQTPSAQPIISQPAVAKAAPPPAAGRNRPCPCGSGVKFKKCCEVPKQKPAPKVQAAPRPEPSRARPAPRSDDHFMSRLSRVM